MTTEQAGVLVALATGAFPSMQQKDLGSTTLVWAEVLGDLDFGIAKAALVKVLASAKFFPTIAEIREAATDLMLPSLPSWEDAWTEVMDELHRVGSWGTPSWDCEATAKAVECIGWMALCRMEYDEVPTVRAQFRGIYGTYVQRMREQVLLPESVRQMAKRLRDGPLPLLPEATRHE